MEILVQWVLWVLLPVGAVLFLGWLPVLIWGVVLRRRGRHSGTVLLWCGAVWGLLAILGFLFLSLMPPTD